MPLSICLDPGHGGRDPGVCANGLQEKDVNLFVALELKKLLVDAGIKVVMTRETDVALGKTELEDLKKRCEISDKAKVDRFLSIHLNSFTSPNATGAESYAIPGGQAVHLASPLVDACAYVFGYHGEAVKDGSHLYVLNKTDAPAVLLEIAYLSNLNDAQRLKDQLGVVIKKLADVLIKALGGTSIEVHSVVNMPSIYVTKEEMKVILANFRKELGV